MPFRASVLLLIFVSVFLWAGAASSPAELFPYQQGWIGADAAYSVPLGAGRTLWLFGDTFIGHRSPATMIHNSIAIRTCKPQCETTYWWSGRKSAHPDSFFRTPESSYYWPLDGFLANNVLYVFLEEMQPTPDGGAFGFDYRAVKLARIRNPDQSPERWQISYQPVSDGNKAVPGVGAAVSASGDAPYLYAFTLFRSVPAHPFIGLLRKPIEQLASQSQPWEYLSTDSIWRHWKSSSAPADASTVLNGNITEMSVEYHPVQHTWLAVFPTPDQKFLTASYSRASRISGPWSAPKELYRYPEMSPGNPHYTSNVFCYAAKEHRDSVPAGALLLTYACNSLKEPEIFSDLGLYRPKAVILPLPL